MYRLQFFTFIFAVLLPVMVNQLLLFYDEILIVEHRKIKEFLALVNNMRRTSINILNKIRFCQFDAKQSVDL